MHRRFQKGFSPVAEQLFLVHTKFYAKITLLFFLIVMWCIMHRYLVVVLHSLLCNNNNSIVIYRWDFFSFFRYRNHRFMPYYFSYLIFCCNKKNEWYISSTGFDSKEGEQCEAFFSNNLH